jgi:hypothetical protein
MALTCQVQRTQLEEGVGAGRAHRPASQLFDPRYVLTRAHRFSRDFIAAAGTHLLEQFEGALVVNRASSTGEAIPAEPGSWDATP